MAVFRISSCSFRRLAAFLSASGAPHVVQVRRSDHSTLIAGHIAHYTMKNPEQVAAQRCLQNILNAFAAGSAPRDCEQRHGGQGSLTISANIVPGAEARESGKRLALHHSGTLADTPFAKCIADAFPRGEPPTVRHRTPRG